MQNYDKNGCGGWQFFASEEQMVWSHCTESGEMRKDLAQGAVQFRYKRVSKAILKTLLKRHTHTHRASIISGR